MRKPRGYWTKDACRKEALKYESRKPFAKLSRGAFQAAKNNGWLDEICSHMPDVKRYTKLDCAREAKKFNTRVEFQKSNTSVYNAAWRNNWLDEVCAHMVPAGNRHKRFVYVIKDDVRKMVYVGLTVDPKRRYEDHKRASKHIIDAFGGNIPTLRVVSDLLPAIDAGKMEQELINDYRMKRYLVLNRMKGGGLGGGKIWDKENCRKEAAKYAKRGDFQKYSAGAYLAALRHGWLDEFFGCSDRKPIGYWNDKENCRKEAIKCKNRFDFRKSCGPAYNSALRNGFLSELFPTAR